MLNPSFGQQLSNIELNINKCYLIFHKSPTEYTQHVQNVNILQTPAISTVKFNLNSNRQVLSITTEQLAMGC